VRRVRQGLWLVTEENLARQAANSAMLHPAVPAGTCRSKDAVIYGIALNYQLHVPAREARMRRCQRGKGAQGFK
jgi:hypothetical protein